MIVAPIHCTNMSCPIVYCSSESDTLFNVSRPIACCDMIVLHIVNIYVDSWEINKKTDNKYLIYPAFIL